MFLRDKLSLCFKDTHTASIHTNITRFKCDFCEKVFYRKDQIGLHLKNIRINPKNVFLTLTAHLNALLETAQSLFLWSQVFKDTWSPIQVNFSFPSI